jgi:death on curing protein
MRYLSLREILELHDKIIEVSGGARGIRDMRSLDSAINQPRLTFNLTDLYPNILTKAAALCFFLVMNHPFIDGNKRIGHAAMETFLILNGFEIEASVDEQEKIILDLAAGKLDRKEFTAWLNDHVVHITSPWGDGGRA